MYINWYVQVHIDWEYVYLYVHTCKYQSMKEISVNEILC